MNTQEMIEVMQAHLAGKPIEFRFKLPPDNSWTNVDNPNWDWARCHYRVKEAKKPKLVDHTMFDGQPIIWIRFPDAERIRGVHCLVIEVSPGRLEIGHSSFTFEHLAKLQAEYSFDRVTWFPFTR